MTYRDALIKKVFNKLAKGENTSYNYHSTQINLADCCSEKDHRFYGIQKQIPENVIYRELPQIIELASSGFEYKKDDPNEEYGKEHTPHITVLYGLEDENDYFKMRQLVKDFGPVDFKIGNISSFRNDENDYDVLILGIESIKLHELHNLLKKTFKNSYKYPEYRSHMTLAYVKKGACKDLEGKCAWTGTTYKADKMIWSHKDKYMLEIPFGK